MQCSKETIVRFFYNVSSFSFLLLLFIHCSSILLAKFFHFVGSYSLIFQRTQNEYDSNLFSKEDEEEEKVEEYNNDSYFPGESCENNHHHLVADIIHGGKSIVFLHDNSFYRDQDIHVQEFIINPHEEHYLTDDEDQDESFDTARHSEHDDDSAGGSEPNHETSHRGQKHKKDKAMVNKTIDEENIFVFSATRLELKKLQVQGKNNIDEEILGDSCTIGSSSKSSSSEWRSSTITYRESEIEDPFSSSSRSCPKWESYTVFQKYDEEMMFFDRVTAQKLHETESLRSIQVCPRSISERIIHKFATVNKKPANIRHNNPYHELEAAYVAQICLTWEALNWNYNNFQRKLSASHNRQLFEPGCPAHIAQQFQQFQVLLQRYIENEPYEHGRRPEVYARMRLLAPKLLLVPEYRDYEDDDDEGFASRISSAAFNKIMEEGIRTFMNFLKADRERPCHIIKSFFGRNRRGSVDHTLLNLLKKVNIKKKMKLKDLRGSRISMRKKRLTVEEEVEILMGLIDLEVVSRVLRMSDINEEQMHWCEEKTSKLRILEGKLQRDSSTLFFPAH